MRALHGVRVHRALTAHGHGPMSNGVAKAIMVEKLADACASSLAALAHSFRRGGGARAQVTAPPQAHCLIVRAVYVVCECIALSLPMGMDP